MWRFLVADDLTVDRFIVRDCDSRLSERDSVAVNAWIKSNKTFHCIRDHPSHGRYSISGGLWGAKPGELRKITKKPWNQMMGSYGSKYLQDMRFLIDVIWPQVKDNDTYCSDSVSCHTWPSSHPFIAPRINYEHIGQVFLKNGLARIGDINILQKKGENKACTSINVTTS